MHLLNISKRKDLKSDIQKKNDELEEYKRILKIQKSHIIENQKKELSWNDEKNMLQKNQKMSLQNRIEDYRKRKNKADLKINKKVDILRFMLKIAVVSYYIILLYVFVTGDSDRQAIISGILAIIPPLVNTVFALIREKKVDMLEIYKWIIKMYRDKVRDEIYDEFCIDIQEIEGLEKELAEIT